MKVGGQGIEKFGQMVGRMVQTPGNKPTPVESYVAMVTKHPAKNMATA